MSVLRRQILALSAILAVGMAIPLVADGAKPGNTPAKKVVIRFKSLELSRNTLEAKHNPIFQLGVTAEVDGEARGASGPLAGDPQDVAALNGSKATFNKSVTVDIRPGDTSISITVKAATRSDAYGATADPFIIDLMQEDGEWIAEPAHQSPVLTGSYDGKGRWTGVITYDIQFLKK